MNNMNLRRPNDFGCKMNYNFNQGCNPPRNPGCGNKPAPSPAPGCGCDTDCGCNIPMPPCDGGHKPPCGGSKPPCGCKPPCGGKSPCGDKPPCGDSKPPCGCKPPCDGGHKPPCGCNPNCDADSSLYNDQLNGMAIGIGYVPWQQWCKVYDLCKGLNQGTIFPPLDLPFYGCVPRGYCKGQGGVL